MWLKCPACSDEWTKLRQCDYLDDEKKVVVSYLCVVCAETLVAWDWLMFNSPISGVVSYTKWKGRRIAVTERDLGDGKKIREEIDCPDRAHVVIEMGPVEVVAWSNGTGSPIRYKVKGSDEEHTADNIFALRSKLMHTVPF